jgi:hypothetical protein
VLVDLGFADASERKLRVELATRLNELIAARRLTRAGTAEPGGACALGRSRPRGRRVVTRPLPGPLLRE